MHLKLEFYMRGPLHKFYFLGVVLCMSIVG